MDGCCYVSLRPLFENRSGGADEMQFFFCNFLRRTGEN
jgi:hypothetical protein